MSNLTVLVLFINDDLPHLRIRDSRQLIARILDAS